MTITLGPAAEQTWRAGLATTWAGRVWPGRLFIAVGLARASLTLAQAIGVLVMVELTGSVRLAGGVAVALLLGTMIGTIAITRLSAFIGRRQSIALVYGVAALGSAVSLVGIAKASPWLFLAGLIGLGLAAASADLSRYTAAEGVAAPKRGRTIGSVLFASAAGGIGGGLLLGRSEGLIPGWSVPALGGQLVLSLCLLLGASALMARNPRTENVAAVGFKSVMTGRRSGATRRQITTLRLLVSREDTRLALLGLAGPNAAMVAIMLTMPVHLQAHGHGLGATGIVVAAHTAGMYVFSPIAGALGDRIGPVEALTFGAAILCGGAWANAVAGYSVVLMVPSMILLGFGWSLTTIASSSLIIDSVATEDRVSAQGGAESIAAGFGILAAIAGGLAFDMAGFHLIATASVLIAGGLMVVGRVHLLRNRITTEQPCA